MQTEFETTADALFDSDLEGDESQVGHPWSLGSYDASDEVIRRAESTLDFLAEAITAAENVAP